MSVKIVEVDVDNEGRRLDNYLISYLKDIPKSKIYKIIRKGEIRVNSSRAKPDRKIKNGDLITNTTKLKYYENINKINKYKTT